MTLRNRATLAQWTYAVMLQQSQMKPGPKLSFFMTNQQISAIKAQALPNQWGGGVKPPKPPHLPTPLNDSRYIFVNAYLEMIKQEFSAQKRKIL